MLHLTPILVVEDDPIIAMAIESAITCSSVAQALKSLETIEPKAAVLTTELKDGCAAPAVEAWRRRASRAAANWLRCADCKRIGLPGFRLWTSHSRQEIWSRGCA